MDKKELDELNQLSQATHKHLILTPKKEYHENYKRYPDLYKFLCRKADESYKDVWQGINKEPSK